MRTAFSWLHPGGALCADPVDRIVGPLCAIFDVVICRARKTRPGQPRPSDSCPPDEGQRESGYRTFPLLARFRTAVCRQAPVEYVGDNIPIPISDFCRLRDEAISFFAFRDVLGSLALRRDIAKIDRQAALTWITMTFQPPLLLGRIVLFEVNGAATFHCPAVPDLKLRNLCGRRLVPDAGTDQVIRPPPDNRCALLIAIGVPPISIETKETIRDAAENTLQTCGN